MSDGKCKWQVLENEVDEVAGEEQRVEERVELGSCVSLPWIIEPDDSSSNFLYVKIRGYELPFTG